MALKENPHYKSKQVFTTGFKTFSVIYLYTKIVWIKIILKYKK